MNRAKIHYWKPSFYDAANCNLNDIYDLLILFYNSQIKNSSNSLYDYLKFKKDSYYNQCGGIKSISKNNFILELQYLNFPKQIFV